MKARSGPIAWLIYIAVRSIFAVMECFPINWNLGTARLFARIWIGIMPRHRNRAAAHLREAFGDEYTPEEYERLANECLASWAMFAVEVICLPRLINTFTWTRYIQPVNLHYTLREVLDGQGVIMVSGHYGPFELSGHLVAAMGFDIVAIMRPLDNEYLNRFVVQSRKTHGLGLLDKKGAMQDAESVLEEGGMLAFIGDQDAGRKGLFVDFFGQPASTYKAIGLLAMERNVPIVVGYARRLGDKAQYEVGVERVIHPADWQQQDDPLRWITQAYTSAIEAIVRRDPAQYLWIHRRWKSKPRVRKGAISEAHA